MPPVIVLVVQWGVPGQVVPRRGGSRRKGRCGRGWRKALLVLLGAPTHNRRRWNTSGKWDCELVPCSNPFRIGTAVFLKVAVVRHAFNSTGEIVRSE